MGVLVQNDEQRSRLQDRISKDLREKMDSTSKQEDVDLEKDSELLNHTHQTSHASWFWGVLILLATLSLIVIFFLK